MIKRGLIALAALVALISGVSAVSAFEAHTINVTAHVENALLITSPHIDMGGYLDGFIFKTGAVFPEEWIIKEVDVTFSESFCKLAQTRVEKVDYQVWVTDKPGFLWLGDALYLGKDLVVPADKFPEFANPPGKMVPVDPPGPLLASLPSIAGPNNPRPILVLSGTLNKGAETDDCPGNLRDTISIGLDVPVFDGFYNKFTDVAGCNPAISTGPKKPSRLCVPSVVLTGDRNVPDGIDLGVDLIVQVTKIYHIEVCGDGIDNDLDGTIDESDCVT